MTAVVERVGRVSRRRYEEIVAELRDVVEQRTQGQFRVGDLALEIEPMRTPTDAPGASQEREPFTVRRSLERLAEDIGLRYSTVENERWTASRWPEPHRRAGVAFTVYRILASVPDEEERFTVLHHPPDGKTRWTIDDANRRVGRQVQTPLSPRERITEIHSLARDEEVAATVTGDLLRRPDVAQRLTTREKVRAVEELTRDEQVATQAATRLLRRPDVAFKAMGDDTARTQVNHAQTRRNTQAREDFEDTHPVAPAVKHLERTEEFLDLVAACHAFVAGAGRVVPRLRDRHLTQDERTVLRENIARVRATADWIETAVDTGRVDMDEALARLLRGEE